MFCGIVHPCIFFFFLRVQHVDGFAGEPRLLTQLLLTFIYCVFIYHTICKKLGTHQHFSQMYDYLASGIYVFITLFPPVSFKLDFQV